MAFLLQDGLGQRGQRKQDPSPDVASRTHSHSHCPLYHNYISRSTSGHRDTHSHVHRGPGNPRIPLGEKSIGERETCQCARGKDGDACPESEGVGSPQLTWETLALENSLQLTRPLSPGIPATESQLLTHSILFFNWTKFYWLECAQES